MGKCASPFCCGGGDCAGEEDASQEGKRHQGPKAAQTPKQQQRVQLQRIGEMEGGVSGDRGEGHFKTILLFFLRREYERERERG